jgi:hypothetical protein
LELKELLKSLEERPLDGIFRVFAIVEEAVRDSEHLALVPPYQFFEGCDATVFCGLHQRQVIVGRYEGRIFLCDY